MNSLHRILPILSLFKNYKREWLSDDIIAGLTVGIMLIPQGMAYAMIAGLPPEYGLYSAIVPVVIYSIFGTSRKLAIGPVAMDSLIIATTVAAFAAEGTQDFITTVLLLTFLVGCIQIILGLFRMGFLVNFLSRPVISGFTTAAALIIGLNQFKYLMGVDVPRNAQVHVLLTDLWNKTDSINWLTLSIGVGAIVLMLGLKGISKRIPVALVVVIIGIACAYFFNFESMGINLVGDIPAGLPKASAPEMSWEKVWKLLPSALALSLIGFMEAMSISKGIDENTENYKVVPNRELIAIGAANAVGSFFSSFIVTAGFSRTAVNVESGAKTVLSRLIGVVIVLLTVLFLTSFFYFLPELFLAAIIIVAVLKLIDLNSPIIWLKMEKKEFLMYIATLFTTIFIGIQEGILAGIIISLLILIYKATVPHMAEVGAIPGDKKLYRNVTRFSDVVVDPDILIIRFDESLFYANIGYFTNKLVELESYRSSPVKTIIIDGSGINSIDISSIGELKKLIEGYQKRGIDVLFAGLKGPVRDSFKRHKIFKSASEHQFFVDIESAVEYSKWQKIDDRGGIARQSNHDSP